MLYSSTKMNYGRNMDRRIFLVITTYFTKRRTHLKNTVQSDKSIYEEAQIFDINQRTSQIKVSSNCSHHCRLGLLHWLQGQDVSKLFGLAIADNNKSYSFFHHPSRWSTSIFKFLNCINPDLNWPLLMLSIKGFSQQRNMCQRQTTKNVF